MCGRYTAAFDKRELENYFGLSAQHLDFHPRYNIAPTQSVPVVSEVEGCRTLSLMRWGLRPHWSKHLLINARAETLAVKPSFRPLLPKRCLVPADGFFEWKSLAQKKVPYRVTLEGVRIFAFAGLWCVENSGEATFVLITTCASTALQSLHTRMPVILPAATLHEAWLRAPLHEALAMLQPYAGEVSVKRVSILVNSPRNDGEHLLTHSDTLC